MAGLVAGKTIPKSRILTNLLPDPHSSSSDPRVYLREGKKNAQITDTRPTITDLHMRNSFSPQFKLRTARQLILVLLFRLARKHLASEVEILDPARLTHLAFPAPTIRGSRYAQLLRQPRRNKQHEKNRHEKCPSRETKWSQRSRNIEGSSDEPPAEPSEREAPAARRQWWPSPNLTSRSS